MVHLNGLEIYQAKQLLRLLDHTDGLEWPYALSTAKSRTLFSTLVSGKSA